MRLAAAAGVAAGATALPSLSLADDAQVPAGAKVYVTDHIVPQPGEAEAFLEEYMTVYAPAAEALGARLTKTVVAPPVWLQHEVNYLEFVWEVDGIGGCWAITGTRFNPDIVAWWESVRKRTVFNDRSYFASTDDFEELAHV